MAVRPTGDATHAATPNVAVDVAIDVDRDVRSIATDSVERALEDVAVGRAVVVVDDEGAGYGTLICAASVVTPELLAFIVRYTAGYVMVAITDADAERLALPPLHNTEQYGRAEAFLVSADAREGVTTGISATDRAYTIRLIANQTTMAADLTRPGHVVPVRARTGGVLRRPGGPEAALDLARLAGLPPAGVLCDIVSATDTCGLAGPVESRAFADDHGLSLIVLTDLVSYRLRSEQLVRRTEAVRMPVQYGEFTAIGYTNGRDEREHLAFVYGEVGIGEDVLVRVHRECLLGDVFHSLRCGCHARLEQALAAIAGEGRGVVVYIRNHEDHNGGLLRKLHAYARDGDSWEPPDSAPEVETPADERDYGTGAQILADLGIRTMRVLTNSAGRMVSLEAYGLSIIGQVPLPLFPPQDDATVAKHPGG